MLKPKHCYANEEVYNYNLFLHTATIRSYALNPQAMTQVRFILRNEKTRELDCDKRDRFFFLNRDGKSKFFYVDDAKAILGFLDIIQHPDISDYTDPATRIKYRSLSDNGSKGEFITAFISNRDERIIDNSSVMAMMVIRKQVFTEMCERLKAIMTEFIEVIDHDIPLEGSLSSHFAIGRFTVLPLNNKQNGWMTRSSLRLQVIDRNQEELKNSICLNYQGKDVLFYSRDSHIEGSSSLSEVVEGFIAGFKNLVNEYHNHYDDINYYIGAIPVTLSEDRKNFMEYVGGRGVGGDNHEGTYRTMIVNVNSDAAPVSSKVNFHYHPEFMDDLYNGLRFLVNL